MRASCASPVTRAAPASAPAARPAGRARTAKIRSATPTTSRLCVTMTTVLPDSRARRVEQLEHRGRRLRVEVAGRLVGQDQRGVVDERPRDGHALLLAARQAVGKARARGRRGRPARAGRARAPRPARRRTAVQLERQQQVLLDGEQRDQVEELEDEADVAAPEARARVLVERGEIGAVDHHAARRRAVDAGDQVEQRRLAGAAPPDQHDDLPARDRDRDVAQHGALGIAFAVGLADVERARRRARACPAIVQTSVWQRGQPGRWQVPPPAGDTDAIRDAAEAAGAPACASFSSSRLQECFDVLKVDRPRKLARRSARSIWTGM